MFANIMYVNVLEFVLFDYCLQCLINLKICFQENNYVLHNH